MTDSNLSAASPTSSSFTASELDGERSIPCDTGTRVRTPFMPDKRFIAGWHVGDQIFLTYRNADGAKLIEQVRVDHYFLTREEDYTAQADHALRVLVNPGVQVRKNKPPVRVKRMERDPDIPGWVRVYPTIPDFWVSKQVKLGMAEREAVQFVSVSPLLPLARVFEAQGVRTFEADVDPLRRFMTDHVVKVADTDVRRCWVDIETDDETMKDRPLREVIGKVPIVSIACELDSGKRAFGIAASTSSHDERELLMWFFRTVLPSVDFVVGWNSSDFDWPFLFARARHHMIQISPQALNWWDALASFKKHHKWAAETQSYALDSVAQEILGEKKQTIDHSGSYGIMAMFRSDRAMLEKYNRRDTELTRRVEEATGYVEADQLRNGMSNNFGSNTYVGLCVDGLVLVEGYIRGTHFPTKHFGHEHDEQYVGAYVLEPVLGRHHNVANFDFSSLYPSCFQTWNISPDTYVPANEVSEHDPSTLTRVPVFSADGATLLGGTCFKRGDGKRMGIVPSIYRVAAEGRAKYKRLMREHLKVNGGDTNDPAYIRLKRLEYVNKEMGLSMYGTMGSIYARIFNRAVAQSVTMTAQYLLRITTAMAEKMGLKPLYGDTDSVFIQISDRDKDVPEFLSKAEQVYSALVERFNCPVNAIDLELEQIFSRIIFTKKKRYFGTLIEQKGQAVNATEIKGLEMKRSDGVKFGRRAQEKLIDGLLGDWDLSRVKQYLSRIRTRVFNGPMDVEDLMATAGLTKHPSQYKSKPPHVRIAEALMQAGEEIYVGQKISYVITDGRCSPMEAQWIGHYKGTGYDPFHYWNDKIFPPMQRIVEVLWPNEDWKAMKVRRKPQRRKKAKTD